MKKYLSEFIATYALVFCGTGAIMVDDLTGGALSHVGVAMAFGLIIMVMVYVFGDVSGAHINPAVTIAFWFSGRFEGRQVMRYIFFQLAGAMTASLTLLLLFPVHAHLGVTLPAGSILQSFFLEVFLTFVLMLVIITVSSRARDVGILAAMAIGSVVLLASLMGGPISGASMNPARSLAPALVSGQLDLLYIYLIAPVVGASLAILGCRSVSEKKCCPLPVALCKRDQMKT